jgi:putative ABC transport system permease protein
MKRKSDAGKINILNLKNSNMDRYIHDITIAFDSILANKLKSVLTALGIIFGVAAVISMLAIGNGAQEEILRQIKLVGVNNIIITPVLDEDESNQSENVDQKVKQKYSPGLSLLDVIAIKQVVPMVREISPEIAEDSYVIQNGKRKSARLVGVTPFYFEIFGHEIGEGELFNNYHNTYGKQVCIISEGLRQNLFSNEDPIGKLIKCGKNWLQVIGVLEKRYMAENTENLHLNTSNEIIYVPINTMLLRYKNRSLVTTSKIRSARNYNDDDSDQKKEPINYHQLDKIVVQVNETEDLIPTVKIIQRMLMRRHLEVADFEITVPELLLKQQQKTKDIFNIVLGAIAGISLVVGGIGIMNIMLASVMERIKEIGTRLAIGARKSDIIVQFLAESTMISFIGGLIGVIFGVAISKLITQFFNILTIVSPFSVFIAFGVSVSIGIAFGYMPAKKAAEKDPVESLRHE